MGLIHGFCIMSRRKVEANTLKEVIEKANSKAYGRMILRRKELHKELLDKTFFLNKFSDTNITERLYCYYNNLSDRPRCPVTSNYLNFLDFTRGYCKHFGRQNIAKNPEIIAKRIATNRERYGGNAPQSSKEIREKTKKTILKKYGVENLSQDTEIKNKKKQTTFKNYGVENPSQSPIIQDKKIQTNLEKYGAEHWMRSDQNLKIFKEQLRIIHFNNLQKKLRLYDVQFVGSIDDYQGVQYNNHRPRKYNFLCTNCNNNWVDHVSTNIPICRVCNPYDYYRSDGEIELLTFIKTLYDGNVLCNCRTIVQKREIDIYIPDLNLAFEFNGVYWHSQLRGKDKKYHLNKTTSCKEKDIKLIHILDHEWYEKQEIVKSRIENLLSLTNNRIHARKCEINIETDTKKIKDFLDKNHLQGSGCKSSIHISLTFNNRLVSIMTFGKARFSRKYEYELLRFTNSLGTIVVGGASRLLSYFEKKYNPKSLVSYADRRWSIGNLYNQLGFKFEHYSCPNYKYFHGNKTFKLFPRNKFQKHKLSKLLETFDSDLTEWENMQANGWNRIWDCGNMVFVKKY